MFISKELADNIIENTPVVYNQMEVEEWFSTLPQEHRDLLEKGAKSFMKQYPKLVIYYFNMLMQVADLTIDISSGSVVVLPHHNETYRRGLTRRTLDSHRNADEIEAVIESRVNSQVSAARSQMQAQHLNRRDNAAEKTFGFFESMARTPYGEYKAFASMRDMGANMEKLTKEVRDLKDRR